MREYLVGLVVLLIVALFAVVVASAVADVGAYPEETDSSPQHSVCR
jgi:hypothetical protein